jgi:FkbM family methyltransferase
MLAYDIGMHNGDDTAYYVAKGFRVVSVEANPQFIAEAEARFRNEIAAGQVVLEHLGIAQGSGEANFYINPHHTVKSTLRQPKGTKWQQVRVPTSSLSELVARHGAPDFMKIDIEHYDLIALDDLREHRIIPKYISSEAHSFEVLITLYTMGYRRFRLVNCNAIDGSQSIRRLDGGEAEFFFRKHSSGPYGNDVTVQDWIDVEALCQLWGRREEILGSGWYDVHGALPAQADGMFMG